MSSSSAYGQIWNALWTWIDTYGDCDGDGFVEYSRHSKDGLVQQGWKDSNDSVFHADGTLAEGPIALCEVQGYVYAAKRGAAHLASVLGEAKTASALESQAATLRKQFDDAFWCDEIATLRHRSGWPKETMPGANLESRPLSLHRHRQCRSCLPVAHSLLSQDFFSGWGIRTVASGEARYNPMSYHNGSVWPHDNALIAAGLARYGFKDMAGRNSLGPAGGQYIRGPASPSGAVLRPGAPHPRRTNSVSGGLCSSGLGRRLPCSSCCNRASDFRWMR